MFTPVQILPYLSHPDVFVRELAARYFHECNDSSPVTVRDALRAYDLHPGGRMNPLCSAIAELHATPECVPEMLGRLSGDPMNPLFVAVCRALSDMPWGTLEATSAEVMRHSEVPDHVLDYLEFRIAQHGHPPELLWKDLVEMAVQRDDAWQRDQPAPFSHKRVWAVKRALARHPDFAAPRVIEILRDASIRDYREMDAVDLAGLLKLEVAIPLLIDKLLVEADMLNEATVQALVSIGTRDVVAHLAAFIPGKEWTIRLFAVAPLERIRRAEAEDALIALFDDEHARDLQTNIAYGLCLQISERGFGLVRQLVVDHAYDRTMVALDEALLGLTGILNIDFPESSNVRKEVDEATARREKRIAEFDEVLSRAPRLPTTKDLLAQEDRPRPVMLGSKVGRNDPCPCHSGKKYKKCCGR